MKLFSRSANYWSAQGPSFSLPSITGPRGPKWGAGAAPRHRHGVEECPKTRRRGVMMLPPLSVGTHTIHFTGLLGGGPFAGFSQDVTYTITVVPPRRGQQVSSDPGSNDSSWGVVKSIYR